MPTYKYEESVFINCPFESSYDSIFNAIVFAVLECGFSPRCAKEEEGSSGDIFNEILTIIKECKYGIHDISKYECDPKTNMARFNMPLELGVFIGASEYGRKQKDYLIFGSYNKFKDYISDLSGKRAKDHKGDHNEAIKSVRTWLHNKTEKRVISGSNIFIRYKDFKTDLPYMCAEVKWTPEEITFEEYVSLAKEWIEDTDKLD